jgi:succinoglycan biosynthesis protein ExoO
VSLAEFIDSNRLYSLTPNLGYLKPMIRTDVVRRLNARYDEHLRIGEDFNFLARIMAHGRQIRLEPSAMYLYRKHATSISHRISAADIHALLDADQRFYRQARLTHKERTALTRRRHWLESLLIYDGVIAAIKGGDPGRGATMALSEPRIWPLLTRPVTSRLKRLGQTLTRETAARTSNPNVRNPGKLTSA